MAGSTQPFVHHLQELYRRFLFVAGAVFIGSIIAYYYRDPLLAALIKPLNQVVFYTSPAGAFNFILDLSMLAGVVFALPIGLFNVIKFLEPALPIKLRSRIFGIVFSSYLLAFIGGALAYYIALPQALEFLTSFTSDQVHPLISAESYFTFTMFYMAAFAIIFQLPLIFLFINWVRPFTFKELMNLERWVILVSFVIAAIINPAPDPITQALTAVPLILIYQLAVIVVLTANRTKNKSPKRAQILTWRLGILVLLLGFLTGVLFAYLRSFPHPGWLYLP